MRTSLSSIGPAVTAAAQTITGTIVGTVTDSSGAAIASADVAVEHVATRASRSVQTSDSGDFVAGSLAPGEYRVQVRIGGFKSTEPVRHLQDGLPNPVERHHLGQPDVAAQPRQHVNGGGLTANFGAVPTSNSVTDKVVSIRHQHIVSPTLTYEFTFGLVKNGGPNTIAEDLKTLQRAPREFNAGQFKHTPPLALPEESALQKAERGTGMDLYVAGIHARADS